MKYLCFDLKKSIWLCPKLFTLVPCMFISDQVKALLTTGRYFYTMKQFLFYFLEMCNFLALFCFIVETNSKDEDNTLRFFLTFGLKWASMRRTSKKMATSLSGTLTVNDATVCSICFEKFKTPRYLPCKHSFCHGCLSSYIVSQCKSTEPRLGFHCPLCREYIPSDGASGKPEDWAGLFPRNDILQKMIDKLDN